MQSIRELFRITIYSTSERSEQFLKQNAFSTYYWKFLQIEYIGTIKVAIGNKKLQFRNLQEKIRKERKKKVLEEIIVDKWCFLVKTLTMLLQDHYRTQNANNACMSYKNEVKMYSSSQAPKLYIPSTLNIGLILWHTQLIVF